MPFITKLVLAALIAAPIASATAQYATPYAPAEGSRVRVVAPSLLDVPIVGRLSAFGGDSLVMQASEGHATMWIPAAYVKQVEASEGHDRFGYGVRYGLAGVAAGAVIGFMSFSDPLERMAGIFAGGVLGGPIGAAVGATLAPEEWRIAWRPETTPPLSRPFRLAIDEGTTVRYALLSDTSNTRRESSSGVVSDTLRLLPRNGAGVPAVALRDLARLEISGGDDKRRGMLLGAAIVGGGTAIFAGADLSKGNISAGDAVGSVAVNAVLGSLIGYAFAPRCWERLPLPAR